jgi:hypothetical protein
MALARNRPTGPPERAYRTDKDDCDAAHIFVAFEQNGDKYGSIDTFGEAPQRARPC